MNPVLPEEVQEFRAAADKAFAAHGGADLARRAEDDPTLRTTEVAPLLRALGLDDLDPRADADSLAAAAALCEAGGRVALPYPVAAALLRDGSGRPFAVVPDGRPRVDHADLFAEWRVASLGGAGGIGRPTGMRLATRLGPFVGDLSVDPGDVAAGADLEISVTLGGWQVLGAADRAVELAVDHVQNRIQFGKPIAAFQAVQFQLADCAVAVAGLRELAAFTLWRLDAAPGAALGDALALRVHAIDVARTVLRACQQLHGAAGVCDEYDISLLTRMLQPALRLPWSAERSAEVLAETIRRDGFAGLFEHGHAR